MKIGFSKTYPDVLAGISERKDGNMVWYNTLPVDPEIKAHRDAYFSRLNLDPGRVVAGGIAHGTRVTKVGQAEAGKYILDSDALMSDVPGLILSITSADCLPVYFFDPLKRCIAMVHAGWKGLVAGVLENVVKEMESEYGSAAQNIMVAIGPHIKVCHYEIGSEIAGKFAPGSIVERDGRLFADLTKEAARRLKGLGMDNVDISSPCTFCEATTLYSARYDKTSPVNGMVAYIGLE